MLTVDGVAKTFEPPTGLTRALVRTASRSPVRALERIDAEVRPGEIVGLVGPNGAGKSTLIRICAGLVSPSSGHVLVDGRDVAVDPGVAKRSIGLLLADERSLYWRLDGRENLRFFGVMAGLSPSEARRRADELLEQFELADRDRRVFGYSSGMRVRLGLARALIARPRLLMLDEPSRSLDPIATEQLHARLRGVATEGTAVLLSSHRLDEVATLCDRVLVIVGGRQRALTDTASLATAGSVSAELLALLAGGDHRDDDRRSEP